MTPKQKDRKRYARKVRMPRVQNLRRIGAPLWVIKSEQIAIAMNRRGLKYVGLGGRRTQTQIDLEAKHIVPLMEDPMKEYE